ncbi:hypothetical protein KP509_07G025500 [Ceratopteris richardii]|uniref:Uncharacterized protein n=1 Tax=Ceratopteris richardii TaxID=49495 RepID=A0A8T2UFD1_CERRI|nr:hypothetical protein KP509_07G025500 [Ceratopteris richardii]
MGRVGISATPTLRRLPRYASTLSTRGHSSGRPLPSTLLMMMKIQMMQIIFFLHRRIIITH